LAQPFWSTTGEQLFEQLGTSAGGLTSAEAQRRLEQSTASRLRPRRPTRLALLLSQFNSPIILLLFCSAVLSFLLDDRTNASIILFILVASGLLAYWQEQGADNAVARLMAEIETHSNVLRDGSESEIPVDTVVPGDIVLLRAGAIIPGDCRIIESKDLFVDEAALTGESFPIEKHRGTQPAETALSGRTNALFLGTHVVSGTATAVVVHTGQDTEFGRVSARLERRRPETGFELGLRRFGGLLIKVTVVFVIVVLAVNVLLHRPFVESLMFALALAVGMTPQLLPAITSIVLAKGAKAMAREQVIVKQLLAIQNLGSMNVLCSDKTGTLTEGTVHLQAAENIAGQPCERVLHCAWLNATFQTGFTNPIDAAIRSSQTFEQSGVQKLDEIPYDFLRRRLSVLVDEQGTRLMITKGALANVLEVCTAAESQTGESVELTPARAEIERRFAELSEQGFRVLGLAVRKLDAVQIGKADEREMTFLGLLVFFDPPKPGILPTIQALNRLGVGLKIITGDNRAVATAVSRQIGLQAPRILTGSELRNLNESDLGNLVHQVDLFAEVEPNQKESLILALKQGGHVVGYLGDGINDAPALHAADVGISVASAVGVAREAAQIVLLKQDLSVLIEGVREGRRTLANTLKYIVAVVCANFGYMFSMAAASWVLPFLPLLPGQILLVNLLADFPAMALATDSVDPEMIERPRRWDIRQVGRFMLVFGLTGSLFDFLTFGILLRVYHATVDEFHTGWFIESVVSGVLIMLLLRTQRPLYKSTPGRALLTAALLVTAVAVALPYAPVHKLLGFTLPPVSLLVLIAVIGALYCVAIELAKAMFYRHESARDARSAANADSDRLQARADSDG
jgi:Mg2+-importing ATPase